MLIKSRNSLIRIVHQLRHLCTERLEESRHQRDIFGSTATKYVSFAPTLLMVAEDGGILQRFVYDYHYPILSLLSGLIFRAQFSDTSWHILWEFEWEFTGEQPPGSDQILQARFGSSSRRLRMHLEQLGHGLPRHGHMWSPRKMENKGHPYKADPPDRLVDNQHKWNLMWIFAVGWVYEHVSV